MVGAGLAVALGSAVALGAGGADGVLGVVPDGLSDGDGASLPGAVEAGAVGVAVDGAGLVVRLGVVFAE